jgi:hypothetical protein
VKTDDVNLDGVALRAWELDSRQEVRGAPYVLRRPALLKLRIRHTWRDSEPDVYESYYSSTPDRPEFDLRLVVPYGTSRDIPTGPCRVEFWTNRQVRGRQSASWPYWLFVFPMVLLRQEGDTNVFTGPVRERARFIEAPYHYGPDPELPREPAYFFDI